METTVPLVEIPHQRDTGRARGPDGEGGAAHTVDLAEMRAELLVGAMFIALIEQVQVLVAERGQEGIGIVELPDLARVVGDAQLVAERRLALRQEALEEALGCDRFERMGLGRADLDDAAGGGLAQKGAHHEPLRAALLHRVHAEQAVRAGTARLQEAVEFLRGDDHGCGSCSKSGGRRPKRRSRRTAIAGRGD
jgi:hypothetical protein